MRNNYYKTHYTNLVINVVISSIIAIIFELFLVYNISKIVTLQEKINGLDNPIAIFLSTNAYMIVIYFIIGIIIFMISFLILERNSINKIYLIINSIEKISNGNFQTKLNIDDSSEFAYLANNINKMIDRTRKLMESERESEKTKNELITNIAHDLRTPLTSILGYLELIKSNDNTDEEKKYIDIVYSKSKRLQNLIEELFSYTKLTYGKENVHLQEVDIVKLMQQLLDETYPLFEKNNLKYTIVSNEQSIVIQVDGNLIARLFENLFSNAIKYGSDGKRIEVKIDKDINQDIVKIEVINFGKLIKKEDINKIFDKFYRVDEARQTTTGGTGLGLAIAKSITDMHNGSINVLSDEKGTRFIVRLPLNLDLKEENIKEI
ncbi:MAG: HAMP domain-containing sensor histidine kinase [Eubacteriales bacterium]|nr:HAMP domain-containing sensor histidine kinase [Eubacteriales bacterium]